MKKSMLNPKPTTKPAAKPAKPREPKPTKTPATKPPATKPPTVSDYQLLLTRIHLKKSCEAFKWDKLQNEIYVTALVWDQKEQLGAITIGDLNNPAEAKKLLNAISLNSAWVTVPRSKDEVFNLYGREDETDGETVRNLQLELWRGPIKGTLHYKVWVWESDSDLRDAATVIANINQALSENNIIDIAKI
jgi:hypothetical protein